MLVPNIRSVSIADLLMILTINLFKTYKKYPHNINKQ